jgi:hypothetical protein
MRRRARIGRSARLNWLTMSDIQATTGSALAKTADHHRRVRRKRIRVVRNSAYVVIILALIAVIAKFAAERILQPDLHEDAQAANTTDVGVGSISQQTDKGRCELVKFDNYSGRTIEYSQHCETNVVRDAHGIPVPVGTVRRLDSISKSFLGDNR